MKIRTGFVTNSSSSSFIVAFKDIPKTILELQAMMFDDGQECVAYEYSDMSCTAAAKRVFDDMKTQTPNDMEKIKEEFRSYGYGAPGAPEYPYNAPYNTPEGKKQRDDYEVASKKFAMAAQKRFMKNNAGADIFIFTYADDGGEAALEHGDIFQKLPHVRISHH